MEQINVTHETANKIANAIGNVKPEDVLRALNEYNKNDEPMRVHDVASAIYHDDKLDVDERQVVEALKALGFSKEDIAHALYSTHLGLNLASEYVIEAMHEAGFSVPEIIEAMNSKDGCDLGVSRIARALSDAGVDRPTIIRGLQEVDSDLEIPHILEKTGILDVEDGQDVYELVQEMDKAGEDSFSIAKKLKELGVSNDNMAYGMFHGLNLDGDDLIYELTREDGANLDFNEVAVALRDGLDWSESDIAKAFYDFNNGDRALSQDEAVIETAKVLKDGLDCSAAEVAEAIHDATTSRGHYTSNGIDIEAMKNALNALCADDGPFGMEIEDAVQVITANKIANAIGNVKPEDVLRALNEYNKNDEPMRVHDVASAIYHDDKLDVDERQVVEALKALGFSKEDIAHALYSTHLGLNLASEYVIEAMHEAGFSVPEIIEAMNSKDGCDLGVSRIARALSDAGVDRPTIIRGLQEVDGDLEIPHILEKTGILDVEDGQDVYELVQEMDKAGEDSFSIAKKLKELGVSNDNMAYGMFHGLNLDGDDLIYELTREDGANLDFNEVAVALRDGLDWSESDIAKAFYDFNFGPTVALEYLIETAKFLKDGLDCSPAEVAEAIHDATTSRGHYTSNGIDIEAMKNAFNVLCAHFGPYEMEIEDAVEVMRERFTDEAIWTALTADPDLGGIGYDEDEAEEIMAPKAPAITRAARPRDNGLEL